MTAEAGNAETAAAQPAGEATQSPKTADRTFTQADLDRLIGKKTAKHAEQLEEMKSKASRAALEAVAERLGVDVEDLDEVAKKVREVGGVDEMKQLKRRLDRAEKALAEREAALGAISAKERKAAVQSAVFKAAQEAGCRDPEALHALIVSKYELEVSDAGVNVKDGESLDKLVKDILAAKPHLQAPAPSTGAGSRPAISPSSPGNGNPLLTREGRIAALASSGIGELLFGRK